MKMKQILSKLYQPILCWLFELFYDPWLQDSYGNNFYKKPIEVLGWRTARVARMHRITRKAINIECITPCFLWFK